jgi:hypothetical protein
MRMRVFETEGVWGISHGMKRISFPNSFPDFRRFRTLPEILFYDAACLLAYSASTRLSGILAHTTLVVDRFHHAGKTCSSPFHANDYPEIDNLRSSNIESINKVYGSAQRTIRYLGKERLEPFLLVISMFVNLKALWRERHSRDDTEDADLAPLIYNLSL